MACAGSASTQHYFLRGNDPFFSKFNVLSAIIELIQSIELAMMANQRKPAMKLALEKLYISVFTLYSNPDYISIL